MQPSPIQKILVPLDLSPFADTATGCACSIAKCHHAQVEGMVVLDVPEIMGLDIPFHGWMLPEGLELSKERMIEAKRRIEDALERFAGACTKLDVPHLEAESQGVPADCILEAASLSDLVVMGLRTHFHFETQDKAGDSLEKVLRAPGAPLLAVPEQDDGAWGSVLIAYDGSPKACQTLKEFARFAQPYEFQITVLMSAKDQPRAEAGVRSAAAYLRAHGLDPHETVVTDGNIREVVGEEYIESSDLVVAGIHSRKFPKDFFVGSLTRMLIDYGRTPLFLS